jgi:putative SOS response-associated peptidase YedK
MCGRVVLETTADRISEQFNAKFILEQLPMFKTGYNISPTQRLCVINNDEGQRTGRVMRWGLVPGWVKNLSDFKATTFNARAETVTTSKIYAGPFKKKRCLVIVDGYYEWQKITPKEKQKYYFHPADGGVLAFAGLWDKSNIKVDDQTTQVLESCTVITCEPNESSSGIHDRMPVILMPKDYDTWLNADTTEAQLLSLLKPCSEDYLEIYKVDNLKGNAWNDTVFNIERMPDTELAF